METRKRASASYDNMLVCSYNLGLQDIGNGDSAHAIKAPYGFKRARIIDIHGSIVETFTQVTTPGYARIGTAGDADKFAELNFGAAAATNAYNAADHDAFLNKPATIDLERDGDSGAALSQLEVTLVAPTGGTPAGQAFVTVVIGWF